MSEITDDDDTQGHRVLMSDAPGAVEADAQDEEDDTQGHVKNRQDEAGFKTRQDEAGFKTRQDEAGFKTRQDEAD